MYEQVFVVVSKWSPTLIEKSAWELVRAMTAANVFPVRTTAESPELAL